MPQLSYNPYVSQYVPAPIQEFQQTAAHFQQEYDENLLASEKLKTMMSSVKTLPGDKARLAMQLKGYEDQLGQMAVAGNYEDAALKVRNLATDFTGNYQSGEIGQLAGSYQNYQTYLADKQKLGNEYAEWNDPYLRYARSGNTAKDGSYRAFNYDGIGKQEDHAKRADEVLGKLAEDGSITSGFQLNPDGLTYSVGKNGSEGVGMQKLKQVAAAKASIFMDTIEGKDYLKKVAFYKGRNLSGQEMYDLSTDYLLKSGMNQLGIKTTAENKLQFPPGWLAKLKTQPDENGMLPTTSSTEATTNAERQEQAAEADNYEVQADGSLLKVEMPTRKYSQQEMADLASAGMSGNIEVSTGGPIRKPIDPTDAVGVHYQQTIKDLIANHAYQADRKRPVTPQALWQQYKDALKNSGAVMPRKVTFGVQMQKEKTAQLTRNGDPRPLFNGRKVALMGVNDGAGKVVNPDELPDDLKDAIADGRAQATVVGRSKTNPYGINGAYIVDIVKKTKEGNTSGKAYRLMVQPDQEEEQAFSTVGQFAKAKYSGAPRTDINLGTDKDGNRRYYRILNIPMPDKTFKQVVEMRIVDAKTNMDAKTGQQSMDQAEDELYLRAESKLKGYRLTSSGQSNAKGDEKDNNVDPYDGAESTEAE